MQKIPVEKPLEKDDGTELKNKSARQRKTIVFFFMETPHLSE